MTFSNLCRAGASAVLTLYLMTPLDAASTQTSSDLVSKGKYLTTAGGCVSLPAQILSGEPFAGNRAIPTPFGTIYSPNITPDKDAGMGNYTGDQFYKALHDGIMASGEYLYPAMPFTSFTKVNRDDVLAIKAYLFSLKPVQDLPNENPISLLFRSISAKAWQHGERCISSPVSFSPIQESQIKSIGAHTLWKDWALRRMPQPTQYRSSQ